MGWLTDGDLQQFACDGYLVVPSLIPEALLEAADSEIDGLIHEAPPREGDGGPGQSAWFMPRHRLRRCEDLLRGSPILDVAGELARPNLLDHAFDHIQVAITVPPWSHIPGGPHIDGHGPGQDPPGSFTMLAGVLLSDQHGSESGNLWVWPGSHLEHQRLFRERGTKVLQGVGGHPTLLDPPTRLGAPVPVMGGRGDLVLAHYLLGHNKGGNTSSQVRRTIYYRLAAQGHADHWEQTFLDVWTEYPSLRPASENPTTAHTLTPAQGAQNHDTDSAVDGDGRHRE
jgi:hypothetical protein